MSLAANGRPRINTLGRTSTFGSARHFEGHQARLADMQRAGVDRQILSPIPLFFRYELSGAQGVNACRAINAELADFTGRDLHSFAAMGLLPLQSDSREQLSELDRFRDEYGFVGVAVGTNVRGVPIASERFEPFWEAAERLDLPVFLHPADCGLVPSLQGSVLENPIGFPTESNLALASLVAGGFFSRYPALRVISAHGGGYFPAGLGRLRHALRLQVKAGHSQVGDLRALPRGLYFDSLTHSPEALVHLVRQVGVEHVVLGSDYPSDMGQADPVDFVETSLAAALDAEALARILSGNAQGLFPSLSVSKERTDGHPGESD